MSYRESYSRRPSNDNNMGQFGGYRVYVGDIGQRMGKTDLEREFGQYGPVTDVWMGRKRDPAAKNYAFVVYRYPQDAEEAVRDRNGRKVCGRKVRVEHAKPVNSNPRRQRGSWGGRGGGGRDYGPQRGGPPARRRSWSRERYSRRSVSQSPPRQARAQQSPSMNRRRNDSFSDSSPKKVMRRSSSESPEPKPQKMKRPRKQMSPSPSPPPQSRSRQQVHESESGSLSPTPPPKKKKKKKQRTQSRSQSPYASDEYDARQYQRVQDGRDDRPANPKSKKKNNYVDKGNYSSDDY